MIDICETYANNSGLIFNEKKSAVITCIKSKFVSVSGGHTLSWVPRLTHLGVVVDKLHGDSAKVESRIRKNFVAVSSVVSRLGGKLFLMKHG